MDPMQSLLGRIPPRGSNADWIVDHEPPEIEGTVIGVKHLSSDKFDAHREAVEIRIETGDGYIHDISTWRAGLRDIVEASGGVFVGDRAAFIFDGRDGLQFLYRGLIVRGDEKPDDVMQGKLF